MPITARGEAASVVPGVGAIMIEAAAAIVRMVAAVIKNEHSHGSLLPVHVTRSETEVAALQKHFSWQEIALHP
jgi:hypothetical protein